MQADDIKQLEHSVVVCSRTLCSIIQGIKLETFLNTTTITTFVNALLLPGLT